MAALKQRTALDTLEFVPEDEQRRVGGLTGRKQMRSLGHIGPIDDRDDQSMKKSALRFPKEATKVLKEWMLAHADHPYPTEEEKEYLIEQTGLNLGQISNWMANTRRRRKARAKRSASPSIRPSTVAIDIPAGRTWDSLSMCPLPEFSRSHKTIAFRSAGNFLTFRVGEGTCRMNARENQSIGTDITVPVSQQPQQNCFG